MLVGGVELDRVEPEGARELGPGAGGRLGPPLHGGGVAGRDFLVRIEQVLVGIGGAELDGEAVGQALMCRVAQSAVIDDVEVGDHTAGPALAASPTVA